MVITEEFIQRIKDLNPSICIRKAQKKDANLFIELFNFHYVRKTSKEYYNWQFFDSPFPSALFLAFDKDDLIGFYGVKIYKLSNNLNSGFSIDFLIKSSHRLKGIGYLFEKRVVEFCYHNQASCLVSLPNAFGNAAFKALGYKSLTKVDTLVLNLNKKENFITKGLSKNTAEMNFVEFVKDENYRKWRFDCNPIYKYKTAKLNNNCFATTKIFEDIHSNQSFVDIVDFNFDNLENAKKLIELITSESGPNSASKVSIWALPHTELYFLLINMGFLNLEQERYLCVKILSGEFEYLSNIQVWNISEADSEIF
jgi:hypothetical protein